MRAERRWSVGAAAEGNLCHPGSRPPLRGQCFRNSGQPGSVWARRRLIREKPPPVVGAPTGFSGGQGSASRSRWAGRCVPPPEDGAAGTSLSWAMVRLRVPDAVFWGSP